MCLGELGEVIPVIRPSYEIGRLLPQSRSPGLQGRTEAENDDEGQSVCIKQET